MADYQKMWEELGMNFEMHDILCNVLPGAIGDVFLSQGNRPEKMDCFNFVLAEVHGVRPAELKKFREDGVIDSVAVKVTTLMQRKPLMDTIIVTGGLSDNEYFASILSAKLGQTVLPMANGRYAGALGAALIARDTFAAKQK